MALLAKLLRSPITVPTVIADRYVWPVWLRWQGVQFGEGLTLVGRPVIRWAKNGEIWLGRDVTLCSRPQSNPLQLSTPCALCLARPGARITIGDGCGLSGTVICAATSVDIGQRVLIGVDCRIVDTDFHPLSPAQRRIHPTEGAASKPIVIGDDVFIGMNAVLLKGTVLGEGCVVGANAVVSGMFPAYTIIAGNPARVIKQLDPSDTTDRRVVEQSVRAESRFPQT